MYARSRNTIFCWAMRDENSRLRTSEGTRKRSSPTSRSGLITMIRPPRRRSSTRFRIRRGWLEEGLAPIRNSRSQPPTSSSSTVAVPEPVTLDNLSDAIGAMLRPVDTFCGDRLRRLNSQTSVAAVRSRFEPNF